MASLYEYAKPLRKPDYHSKIIESSLEETPFLAMLKDSPAPTAFKGSWAVESPLVQHNAKSAEGTDKTTGFGNHLPYTLEGMVEFFRSNGWQVTRQAEATRAAWENTSSPAYQQAKDAAELLKSIEFAFLSDQEAAVYSSSSQEPVTRAVSKWLVTQSTSISGLENIPNDLLLSDKQVYGGALSAFTSTKLREMMAACAAKRQGRVSLVGFVGIDLKGKMSTFQELAPTVQDAANIVRANRPADDTLKLKVDYFSYDGGDLRVLLAYDLYANSSSDMALRVGAGAPASSGTGIVEGTNSSECGYLLDMGMWAAGWMKRIEHTPLDDNGAGKRGFHEAWARLECLNPKWQAKIIPTYAN